MGPLTLPQAASLRPVKSHCPSPGSHQRTSTGTAHAPTASPAGPFCSSSRLAPCRVPTPSPKRAVVARDSASSNGSETQLSYQAASRKSAPAEEHASTSEDDSDVLLELRDVHKSFGSKKILRGCSFKVRRGEAVGVIGASGTGKSTTLRLLAGLLTPDAGEVLIKGEPRIGLLSDKQKGKEQLKIGMVFQSSALFDSLTVGRNVGFLLYEHTDMPEARIEQIVKESLAEVGLKDVEHLYPSQLSGGMQKRVALARAVVRDDAESKMEQVLMYDEPTAGLDPVASTVVEDLIRNLHKPELDPAKGGIASYIVVTHQHSTITRACDRIIFLHQGQVVWQGSSKEFLITKEPIVRQFATGSLEGPIVYR